MFGTNIRLVKNALEQNCDLANAILTQLCRRCAADVISSAIVLFCCTLQHPAGFWESYFSSVLTGCQYAEQAHQCKQTQRGDQQSIAFASHRHKKKYRSHRISSDSDHQSFLLQVQVAVFWQRVGGTKIPMRSLRGAAVLPVQHDTHAPEGKISILLHAERKHDESRQQRRECTPRHVLATKPFPHGRKCLAIKKRSSSEGKKVLEKAQPPAFQAYGVLTSLS